MQQSNNERQLSLPTNKSNNFSKKKGISLVAAAGAFAFCGLNNGVNALNNGLGLTPPMGWNTWNRYYCDINQTVIYTNADQIKTLGLDKLGYVYVNVDDCWLKNGRDSEGRVIVDPETFPDGMRAVGDYIHERGLKFGIYNSAGTMTCEGRAGSLNHEERDVEDFVEWGVDFLKYDNCFNEGIPSINRYEAMRDALAKAGRDIFFSICNWGLEEVWEWGSQTGNSWRTAGDITPTWTSVKYNFEMNQLHPEIAGPGGWNDPDMLEVGNEGLTHEEERSHFALWCIVKAPLILGCDLNTVSQRSLDIIKNERLIAINQDPQSRQAVCVQGCGSNSIEVFGAPQSLDDGYFAVVAVNWDDTESHSLALDFVAIGAAHDPSTYCEVHDLWTGQHIGTYKGQYFSVHPITPHDNVSLKIKCSDHKYGEPTLAFNEHYAKHYL